MMKNKSVVLCSYILLCFLGWLGFHRCYLGRYKSAVGIAVINILGLWLLTKYFLLGSLLLSIGITWWLFDFYFVHRIILEMREKVRAYQHERIVAAENYPLISRLLWYIRLSLTLMLSVVVVYQTYILVMNYAGYCHEEKRFLSDQELIEAGVIKAIRELHNDIRTVRKSENLRRVDTSISVPEEYSFGSANDFLQRYPACCELEDANDRNYRGAPTQKEAGNLRAVIKVTFSVNYTNSLSESVAENRQRYYPVGNCGE